MKWFIHPMRFLLLLLPGLIFLISCNRAKTETKNTTPSALQVNALILSPRYFESRFIANANLIPYEETELKAPISGTVLAINFQEGQEVLKGQPLVQLDDRIWKARIRGLQAQLSIARSDVERNQSLLEVQGVSQEIVDKANSLIEELQAQVDELQVNISLANVSAPFNGRVGMRNFSLGSYLTQGQTITSLVQKDRLKVDFNIPERLMQFLKKGEEIKMVYQNDTLSAVIYAIDPKVNIDSRTLRVRCEMPNPEEKYMPGVFVEVIIPVSKDDKALVVPTSAVIPDLNAQTIYVYQGGKARRRTVQLGDRTDKQVRIRSGLNPGDTIITTGLMEVKDQLPVVIDNLVKQSAL
ncbi:MAG: efflux RND transporter periplasmic adaptor subunit [Bacteroidales bacterium]|jgi:membrane fusion protein (multidrug efflux system)